MNPIDIDVILAQHHDIDVIKAFEQANRGVDAGRMSLATIYDVAKRAGVSPKTVSRVVNGDAPVGAKTRAKVEQAIASIGYVPSLAARTMRSNRSGLVGVVTGAISLISDSREASGLPDLIIVQRLQRVLEEHGFSILIADTGGRKERVSELMRTFAEHRVEGLIYVADHHQQVQLPAQPEGTSLVLANCYDDLGSPCVLPNDRLGQRSLVEALIARGHERIAYLTLNAAADATIQRTRGYREALEAAGLQFDGALVMAADRNNTDPQAEAQLLWDALERLLSGENPPTAICFGNDRMAMRAYGILRTRGLKIPDDISLAGFDNHRLIAETLYPQLTTVELPYAAIGVRAAELLVDLIKGREAPEEPQLVSGPVCWRDSVLPQTPKITKLETLRRNSQ